MEATNPIVTIIEGVSRFRVFSKFSAVIVNYYKTLEGRFYDFQTKMWSFPIESMDKFTAFLAERHIKYKIVQFDKFVSILKTNSMLNLKFAGYQDNFKIFEALKGAAYDRSISMFVIPKDKLVSLEKTLKDHDFEYQIINLVNAANHQKRTKEDQAG